MTKVGTILQRGLSDLSVSRRRTRPARGDLHSLTVLCTGSPRRSEPGDREPLHGPNRFRESKYPTEVEEPELGYPMDPPGDGS